MQISSTIDSNITYLKYKSNNFIISTGPTGYTGRK